MSASLNNNNKRIKKKLALGSRSSLLASSLSINKTSWDFPIYNPNTLL